MSSTETGTKTSENLDSSIMPAAGQAAAQVPDHKDQLRKRVEARLAELKAAVVQLGGDAAHEQRVRDIEAAMQAAQGSLSGGWEKVGEMEAAQLSQWLESNKNLGAAQDGAKDEPSRDAGATLPALPIATAGLPLATVPGDDARPVAPTP